MDERCLQENTHQNPCGLEAFFSSSLKHLILLENHSVAHAYRHSVVSSIRELLGVCMWMFLWFENLGVNILHTHWLLLLLFAIVVGVSSLRCRHRRVSENFYENLRIRNFRTFVHFVFRMLMISDVCCVDPIVGVCVLSLCVCVCVLLLDIYGTACVWLCDFECVLLYVCCQCIYSFDCIVQ